MPSTSSSSHEWLHGDVQWVTFSGDDHVPVVTMIHVHVHIERAGDTAHQSRTPVSASGCLPRTMAPINKAQSAGVSSGSFLELRIQVEKQKETHAKEKAAGYSTTIVGRTKRNGKVRRNFRHLLCTSRDDLSAHRSQANGNFQTKVFTVAPLETLNKKSWTRRQSNQVVQSLNGKPRSTRS